MSVLRRNETKTPAEIIPFVRSSSCPTRKAGGSASSQQFPVLHVEGSLEREGSGVYDWMNGIGAHEIIIETPEHARRLEDLPESQVEKVLWAYRDRILDLERGRASSLRPGAQEPGVERGIDPEPHAVPAHRNAIIPSA